MNLYKILSVSYGVTQVTMVAANDITSAIYAAGVGTQDVIKAELVDSTNVVDYTA